MSVTKYLLYSFLSGFGLIVLWIVSEILLSLIDKTVGMYGSYVVGVLFLAVWLVYVFKMTKKLNI